MKEKHQWVILNILDGEYVFSKRLTVKTITFARKFISKAASRNFLKKYSFEPENYKIILYDSVLIDKMKLDRISEKI